MTAVEADSPARPAAAAGVFGSLRLPVVWLSVLLFFVYTGIEATAGQWAFTLFHEGRGVGMMAAGLWVSVYWGGLMAGRVGLGFVADRIDAGRLVRLSLAGLTAGALLIWQPPTPALGLLGLALMGLSASTIFPTLIAATPARLGTAHAAHVIGFQVGAAALGIALLPGVAGVLAEHFSLEALGPYLALACVLAVALHEAVLRQRPASHT